MPLVCAVAWVAFVQNDLATDDGSFCIWSYEESWLNASLALRCASVHDSCAYHARVVVHIPHDRTNGLKKRMGSE